jgi:hypothetical protein
MVAGRILGGGSAQVELQQAARQTPVSSTERRRAAQAAHRGQGERGEREREGEHGQGGREGSRRFIEQEGRGEGEPWRETTAFKAINVDITTINGERNGEGRGETAERRARIGRLGVGRLGVAGGARPGRGTTRRGKACVQARPCGFLAMALGGRIRGACGWGPPSGGGWGHGRLGDEPWLGHLG